MATGARKAVRLRVEEQDRLDPTPPGEPDKIYLSGLIVLPREHLEQGRGWVTVDGYDIWVLPSSRVGLTPTGARRAFQDGDIVSSDQIELDDGTLWQVDGNPAGFDKVATRKGTRIRVKKVS